MTSQIENIIFVLRDFLNIFFKCLHNPKQSIFTFIVQIYTYVININRMEV